jgi:hypothetical protein
MQEDCIALVKAPYTEQLEKVVRLAMSLDTMCQASFELLMMTKNGMLPKLVTELLITLNTADKNKLSEEWEILREKAGVFSNALWRLYCPE